MFNTVCISGRLVDDPSIKTTSTGKQVATFRLAVSGAAPGNQTGFFSCIAWENTAEIIDRYFSKGKWIDITGTLQHRTYQTKDGKSRETVEIVCRNVGFGGVTKNSQQPVSEGQAAEEDMVDDMPF